MPDEEKKHLRDIVVANTGVSRTTYYRYLHGKSHDQRIALAICMALGVSLPNLLDPNFEIPATIQTLTK